MDLFTESDLDRLEEIGPLLRRKPLPDWSAPDAPALLGDAEVIVGHWGCPPLDASMLELAPRLRMYAHTAGTVKGTVTDAVWERDILVTSGAAANAEPVAEYTLAAILFANKDIFWSRESYREPDLSGRPEPGGVPVGNWGKTIGIVGASLVGRRVIQLLRSFPALSVAVYDPFLSHEEASALGVAKLDLDPLCASVDVLSVHAPALASTQGMIGPRQLAALRDGATVINTARGSLIDPDALTLEVASGRLSAVLDVTEPEPLPQDSPLLRLPNVFLTPHQAGSMGTELQRMVELMLEEVHRFAAGEPPLHPITQDQLEILA